jgi:hypothetical protein
MLLTIKLLDNPVYRYFTVLLSKYIYLGRGDNSVEKRLKNLSFKTECSGARLAAAVT